MNRGMARPERAAHHPDEPLAGRKQRADESELSLCAQRSKEVLHRLETTGFARCSSNPAASAELRSASVP